MNDDNKIYFYNFLDYENLENLDFSIKSPEKYSNNIYKAEFINPYYFYLPKSKIIDIYENEHSKNKIRYEIDLEEQYDILIFLSHLDSLAVNLASMNSKNWFKKELSSQSLLDMINYTSINTDDGLAYINIDLEKLEYIDKLEKYNEIDNESNILVKIEGIEFYKNAFNIRLVFENLSIIEEPNFEETSEQKSVKTELYQLNQYNLNKQESSERYLDNKINNDIINDLAEKIENLSNDNISDYSKNEKTISNSDISNLEKIITQKKIDHQRQLLNAERAQKAHLRLTNRAIETEKEIETLSNKILDLSQNSISLN